MGDYMNNSSDFNNYGNHEVKITDRNIISLSGINKILSFNDKEFVMESNMGMIVLKGEKLEIIRLDTHDGNVKIKGKIVEFSYIENIKKSNEQSFISKLFK